MTKLIILDIILVSFCGGCIGTGRKEREINPWVLRLNLDGRPNTIGLALNKNMYAAYDGLSGWLYKVWKGGIHRTGPVFDNIHGNQPYSQGTAYIEERNRFTIFCNQHMA